MVKSRSDAKSFTPPKGFTKWPPVQDWTDALWTHWLKQHAWTLGDIRQYLHEDRYRYGFGLTSAGVLATVADAHELGTKWLYLPTPRAITLHSTETRYTLWGGSAGGAKSMSARWELWRQAFNPAFTTRIDAPYRAIIVRRELEQLRRTHLDKAEMEAFRICEALGETKAIKVTSQPAVITINTTNAKIICAHCNAPNDHEKYLSEDYDDFLGDEATWLLPKQIAGVQSRVRSDTKVGRPGRMFLTTNPGGPAHEWCVEHFIAKTVDRRREPLYRAKNYGFIRSRLRDNPYYMDPDGSYRSYEESLDTTSPERRRQLLDGDWDAVVGQFFDAFDASKHIQPLRVA